ncbi:hypothetical protein L1987_78284 [Smallanthus sonchifolius]|uniref:Uncharacterized protein n=1 Tax=Smallanthus sonchifolius TaxID=185202 RepID=A0ACB8ZD97_9ASTR|nr:hypothetical protein L1987_78284 [Smallanthus sonchifolius]
MLKKVKCINNIFITSNFMGFRWLLHASTSPLLLLLGLEGLLYPIDCKKIRETYDKACRRTWVRYFDRQYCASTFKSPKSLIDGGVFTQEQEASVV